LADLSANWACKVDYTAIFTALLFVATLGLWLATRRLVKSAEDTGIRQLRGYVSVSPNAMVFTLAQPLDIHDQSIRIQAICKNHGQTPVRNVQFRYEVQVLPHPLVERYQFREARRIHSANDALAPSAQTESMFLRDQPLTVEELTNIRNDTARIYWWGVATYRDVFDRERLDLTRLCRSPHSRVYSESGTTRSLAVEVLKSPCS
jgi:hypothetical protein